MATNIFHKQGRDAFFESENGKVNPADFKLIGWTDETDLNKVYELFNSIDAPFWENPRVQLHSKLQGARSLSVGDLIQLDTGEIFEVASFGFNKVISE